MTNGNALRIGLDGFNLAMPRGTGIATYARVLSQTLQTMGHAVDVLYGLDVPSGASDRMREILFFDQLGEDKAHRLAKWPSLDWVREARQMRRGYDAAEIRVGGQVVLEPFRGRLPGFDRILNIPKLFPLANRYFARTGRFLPVRIPNPPRIMHWTYPLPIRLEGARNVYTLHDLVPLRLPYTTLDNKPRYEKLIRRCIQEGDAICTVSEASRQDILAMFPEAADKIVNTYESVDLPTSALQVDEAGLAAHLSGIFGLQHRGYFLFFGSLEPKKNIGRIVEAYLASGVSTPLVLVGAQAWKSEQELRLVQTHKARRQPGGAGPDIIEMEYLPFSMLLMLISGARGVVFPSLYEGFGLPVLEAMTLGTPAITSTTSSLPEIAGDAALLVNPYDVREIAAALQRLDADPALVAQLGAAGRAQAERFGIPAYQQHLERLYAKALA